MALFVNSNLALLNNFWNCPIHQQFLSKSSCWNCNLQTHRHYFRAITEDGSIEIVTPDHEDALFNLASPAAHLICPSSSSPLPRYPLGVGPAIEDGFYYDTDTKLVISNEHTSFPLPYRRRKWRNRERNFPSIREEKHQSATAREISVKWIRYKLKLIEETLWRRRWSIDLPLRVNTWIFAVAHTFHQLVASKSSTFECGRCYWRGNSGNAMMQRLFGTVWRSTRKIWRTTSNA